MAQGLGNVLALTLGTAVGAGLLLGGKLWHGARGAAGEIGMTYLSLIGGESGRPRPIEAAASAGAIELRLKKSCDAQAFVDAAAGDAEASGVLREAFQIFVATITNVHLLLDVELVVFGGGMARAGDQLKTGVVAAFHQLCPKEYGSSLRFELSKLGSLAGAMGSAAMVLEAQGLIQALS